MNNKSKYTDIAFLSFFGLLIILSIIAHFQGGSTLSINNYLAFASWVIIVCNYIFSNKKWKYGISLLLLLSTFNVINFYVIVVSSTIVHLNNALIFNSPGFNIIAFVLLIGYILLNGDNAIMFFKTIFKGSDKEQEEKRNKMIVFYYDKFNVLEISEIDQMFKSINDYPAEAQIALKKVVSER